MTEITITKLLQEVIRICMASRGYGFVFHFIRFDPSQWQQAEACCSILANLGFDACINSYHEISFRAR